MEKQCSNCGSFTAYYSQGFCCYLRENCGYCNNTKQIKQKTEICDKWRIRHTYLNLKRKKSVMISALKTSIKNINAISDFLEKDE